MALSKSRRCYLGLNYMSANSYSLYDVNGEQTGRDIEAVWVSHPALSYSDYHGDMIVALSNFTAIEEDDEDYYEGCWLRNVAYGGQELLLPLELRYVEFTKNILDALETYLLLSDDTGWIETEKQQEAWENYGFRDAINSVSLEVDKLEDVQLRCTIEDITDILTADNCEHLQDYLSDNAYGWEYTTYCFGKINGKNLYEVLDVLLQDINKIAADILATYKSIILDLTRYLIVGKLPVQLILPLVCN